MSSVVSPSSMFAAVPVSSFHSHVERLSRPVPSCGGADGFDVELDALYSLQSSPSALAAVYNPTAAEQHKNRYCDVLPNSSSRVRLLTFEGCYSSDYVNASLVRPDMFSFPAYPYIAAQAPLSTCVADFWYMVWEQCSELVVMLTKEKERGKDDTVIRKADRYWPANCNQTLTVGTLNVTLTRATELDTHHIQHIKQAMEGTHATSASLTSLLSAASQANDAASTAVSSLPSSSSSSPPTVPSSSSSSVSAACPIVVREFEVSCGGVRRTVRQLHYIGWPDHGVPSDFVSFASLLQLYRLLRSVTPRAAPIVVHCSAGIGRTGTFCTIDLAIDQIAHTALLTTQQHQQHTNTGSNTTQPVSPHSQLNKQQQQQQTQQACVSVANIVRLLRVSRPGMVQTKGQYNFCYRFIDYCIANNQHTANNQPHSHSHSYPHWQQQQTEVAAQPNENGHSDH